MGQAIGHCLLALFYVILNIVPILEVTFRSSKIYLINISTPLNQSTFGKILFSDTSSYCEIHF
jgi:hypothetical protein